MEIVLQNFRLCCFFLVETIFVESVQHLNKLENARFLCRSNWLCVYCRPFEILTDPHMNEMQHYCLPGLLPLMKDATCQLHDAFEFCEEYLSCRNPYGVYRQGNSNLCCIWVWHYF